MQNFISINFQPAQEQSLTDLIETQEHQELLAELAEALERFTQADLYQLNLISGYLEK